MEDEEKFSEDERENLSINNELMRLKMSAQYGDAFMMKSASDIPPEIENAFLKSIIAFEEQYQNANGKSITIYEKIGKPAFKDFSLLEESRVEEEINRILSLLSQHGIGLSFLHGPYSNEIMYRFITEELLQKEIDDIDIPGMTCNFIYEEYHINNQAEIEETTQGFFRDWFNKEFHEFSHELDYELVSSASVKMNREEVFRKIHLFTDCFKAFENEDYNIHKIQVDEQPDGTAMGFSEGACKYEAILENGESQHFEGPFKLYMRREHNFWSIFCFAVPGFEL